MVSHGKDIKIFAGNANKPLAESICRNIGKGLGDSKVTSFSDGEISVSLYESVRGSDVFYHSAHLRAGKQSSDGAAHHGGCLQARVSRPYHGGHSVFRYARQDRKAKARDPISAKLVANLITSAGADRVLTMDLHASQIQGFF